MAALLASTVLCVSVAIYLVMRNKDHWGKMKLWHKSLVVLAAINALILVAALCIYLIQNS